MKLIDEYNIKARFFPVIIAAFPLLLFLKIHFKTELQVITELLEVKFVGEVTISIAILWFLSMLNRELSKYIEKCYFGEPRIFPTTYLMLYSNQYLSDDMKDIYREKVKESFNRTVPSRESEQESPQEAIKQLGEIAQLVLESCRSNQLLFKHNIWYGFWRNLTSAIMIVLPFLLACIVFSFYKNQIPFVQLAFLLSMIIIIIFHKKIWKTKAEQFANKLFSIFIHQNLN